MSQPIEPNPATWGELVRFTAALAVARARRGLLTVREIRDALDEAYRAGFNAARALTAPPTSQEETDGPA